MKTSESKSDRSNVYVRSIENLLHRVISLSFSSLLPFLSPPFFPEVVVAAGSEEDDRHFPIAGPINAPPRRSRIAPRLLSPSLSLFPWCASRGWRTHGCMCRPVHAHVRTFARTDVPRRHRSALPSGQFLHPRTLLSLVLVYYPARPFVRPFIRSFVRSFRSWVLRSKPLLLQVSCFHRAPAAAGLSSNYFAADFLSNPL